MKHEPGIRHRDAEYLCTCGRVWPCIMAFGNDEPPRKMVLGDIMLPRAVHDARGTWVVYGRYPTNWGFKLDTIWPCDLVYGHGYGR